jgi:hypothetical protein
MPKDKVKVKGLDQEFRLPGWTLSEKDKVVWFRSPITAEEAERANAQRKAVVERLLKSGRAEHQDQATQIMSMEDVKADAGEAWTLRKAAIQALCSTEYPNEEPEKGKEKTKGESAETTARMGYLGIAFSRAPRRSGAYVSMDETDVALIRRKARELGPKQMLPVVMALLNEALDAAEGPDVRERRSVEYGEDPVDEALALTVDGATTTKEPAGNGEG